MSDHSNIKNPGALIGSLSQQHPYATRDALEANGWNSAAINVMSDDAKREVCFAIQRAVEARHGHRAVTTLACAKSQVEAYGMEPIAVEWADGKFGEVPAAAAKLWAKVGIWRPLCSERNQDGTRKGNRKPLMEQQRDWVDAIRRADRALNAPTPETTPEVPTIEVKPPVSSLREDTEQLITWAAKVRTWQEQQGHQPWGMRQVKKGVALMGVGFPLEAVKDAFTIDFPLEARRFHGVTSEFDVIAWGRSIATGDEGALEAALRRLSTAPGVNVATTGGPGIGKTHTTELVMGADFDHTITISCNPNTAGADFYGFLTPGMEFSELEKGFRLSEFAKALILASQGKRVAILLDEMDALDPAVAIALNRALEQRVMGHRYLGEPIAFGNITFFGAMNSLGLGATADFTGRERQDAAFLDRFVRVRVKFDAAIERKIAEEMLAHFGA